MVSPVSIDTIALEPAFWAQFPGNFKYIARKALVSTRNFAGLASLHNFPIGRPRGNHWGEAVTLLETTAAGPYFFNFHQNDLGNFTVIGPSVNEASRIEPLTKTMGRTILMTADFAKLSRDPAIQSLGFHVLRGVREPREIFTLAD